MADSAAPLKKQLEDTLLLEIADKAKQIDNLLQEKSALERMLLRSREQNEIIKRTDVTRKNSVARILVEGSIIQSMQHSKNPIPAKTLYKAARFVVPALRENTFRSYLHRMKARGLVERLGQGMWRITVSQDAKKQA